MTRQRLFNHLMIVSILLCTQSFLATAQTPDLDILHDAERSERITIHQHQLAPGAIPSIMIEGWISHMNLDENQADHLKAVLEEYESRLRNFEKKERNDVLMLWPAAYEYNRKTRRIDPVFTPQILKLYKSHDDLMKTLLSSERFLFNTFQQVLDNQQTLMLKRIRANRLRTLFLTATNFPEETIDLTDLLDSMNLTDQEQELLMSTINRYYTRIIHHLESDSMSRVRKARRDIARFLIAIPPGWELILTTDQQDEVSAHLTELMSVVQGEGASSGIASINSKLLGEMADKLTKIRGLELRTRYHHRTMPEFFEEERQILEIADRARLTLIGDNNEPYRTELDAVLIRMSQRLDATSDVLSTIRAAQRAHTYREQLPFQTETPLKTGLRGLGLQLAQLDLRIKRRKIMQQLTSNLSSLTAHLAEHETSFLGRHRTMLEARQDADEFRKDALGIRMTELRMLIAEVQINEGIG